MQGLLATIFLAAPFLEAFAQAHKTLLHETASVPRGWNIVGDADESSYLQLSIALAQPRLGELKRRVAEISNINHVDFGAHLTQSQLQEYQKFDEESASRVIEWLHQAGVEDAYLDSAWVRLNATVGVINSLLECKLEEYETPLNARVYRTTEYSLPSDLASQIQFVYPVTQFIEMSPKGPQLQDDDAEIMRRQASSE